ncbi:MAG TPA: adenylate/guanylate cyclase domain-containing protein [Nitrosopumilus sp.]|nr:adenylate/guanylate cyclase domain-containing protein [Thermoproteota archaeon]HJJ22994.1 adenylate/guanylate cyclase domain-containing protein [Nitrosopumilus sp.]
MLVLVLSATILTILITTILFLNFDNTPLFGLQENIIVIAVVLMIGLGSLTYFLSKRLSEPIIKLSDAANKIAQGDFDVRTNIKSHDEIGQLSASFDSMARKLQDSLIAISNRDEIIKEQEDLLLKFSKDIGECCVCIVDIVNSTKKTAKLSNDDTSHFYEIFINSIANIVEKFDGIVVKNIGDSLLFYFPISSQTEKQTVQQTLDCCLEVTAAYKEISQKLKDSNLPEIEFRTSATYGTVNIAKMKTSFTSDIFGETVNRCAKINRAAPQNSLVIGKALYQKAKSLEFSFREIKENTIFNESEYTVYLVRKQSS